MSSIPSETLSFRTEILIEIVHFCSYLNRVD